MPKAKQCHVNIYGIVGYEPSNDWADMLGFTRLQDVAAVLNANTDADEVIVHINSPGGDVTEGFAIHDLLANSGKKVTTICEGRCYSIATVILLSGSARLMAKNSEFMIHQPWGGAMGTADDLQKAADWIRKAEDQLVQFYVEKTGVEEQTIRDMMKDETFMSANEALDMKFITAIQEPVKAYALLPKKPTTQNSHLITIDMNASDKTGIKTNISAICKKFGWGDPFAPKKVALDYTIANGDEAGKTLHIDTEAAEPAKDDAATIDGAPAADGTYEVNDGLKITCVDGKVESTEKPAESTDDSDEVKALKADLKKAKADLAAAKAEKLDNEETITAMAATLEKVAKTKSGFVPPTEKQDGDPPSKKKDAAFDKSKLRENLGLEKKTA